MSGEKYIKIVFYGPAGSGKTTVIDTLYKLCSKNQSYIASPEGKITKIAKSTGETLYFDRGILKSRKDKNENTYFHVFTVAGQDNLGPLRKKILHGTDAIVFVFDSQTSLKGRNINSIRELKKFAGNNLIKKIPMIVMANKQDLEKTFGSSGVEQIFLSEDLKTEVFGSIALPSIEKNVYETFEKIVSLIL